MNKITRSQSNNISYKGIVTIDLVNNSSGRVYSSRTYTNTGHTPLFEFLANCICGTLRENLKPKYLGLYNDDGSVISGNLVLINTTPKVTVESDSATAILKFLIPLVRIKADAYHEIAEDANKPIKRLKLFANSNFNDVDNPSAEIYVNEGLDIELPEGLEANQVNLLIQWKMVFKN